VPQLLAVDPNLFPGILSMTSVFKKYSTNVRIGELLVQAGMLTQGQMTEATRHAGTKRLQIGQILVMYGYLNARDLQAALDAQSAIRDKSVDLDSAIRCLKIVHKTSSNFLDVLHEETGIGAPRIPTGKLGQLLFDAELVTLEQLSLAMQRSLTTGLPLGRMLVLEKVLSDQLLTTALEIQVKLRDEMLTRGEAIKALRQAAGLPAIDTPSGQRDNKFIYQQPRKRGIRLGEMMVLAGLLTDTDVMNALEWGLVNNQPIGHVFVRKGLVKQDIIDAALALQRLVDENKLEAIPACECLGKVAASGMTVEEAVKEAQAADDEQLPPVLSYRNLLTLSRVVSDEDIEAAFDLASMGPQIMGKILAVTGCMDAPTLRATLKAHLLLSKGVMTQDDAVASLDYCLHQRPDKEIDYDVALNELGWSPKTPLKLSGEPRRGEADADAEPKATEQDKAAKAKLARTISPEDTSAASLYQLMAARNMGMGPVSAGAEDSDLALVNSFSRLAQSYCEQGNFLQSQLVFERILVDRLNKLGPNHENLIDHLQNLAGVLCSQGKFNQAEPFMRRVIGIMELNKEFDKSRYADALSILAGIYYRQDKFGEAEPLANRVVQLREGLDGHDGIDLIDALNDHAKVLRKLGRTDQAERVYTRAQAALNQIETQGELAVAEPGQ
jgi:tetratricopeptide (TPR) repeat protein